MKPLSTSRELDRYRKKVFLDSVCSDPIYHRQTLTKATNKRTEQNMVKLQEVEDEHFVQDQPAPASTSALPKGVVLAEEDEDDMAYSDTGSFSRVITSLRL